MRSDIVPGGTFPDYELPDHTGTPHRLSELQGEDPLILTLARGHYCPKEHQQHLELAAFYPKVAVAYTQIATISTDDHHTLQEFRASVGAQWTFLSDPERRVQRDLDIQEYNLGIAEVAERMGTARRAASAPPFSRHMGQPRVAARAG
jgi:peroxiredoxin